MKMSTRRRRERALNVLALGAFILTALMFLFLLYYGRMLAGPSSRVY